MSRSGAVTRSMCSPVTCWSVSTALTLNGSARATVSVPLLRERGIATQRRATSSGTLASTLWSTEMRFRLTERVPACRARKLASTSGIHEAELDQDLRQVPAVALLLPLRQLQLLLRHQPRVEEVLRQRHPLLVHRHKARGERRGARGDPGLRSLPSSRTRF